MKLDIQLRTNDGLNLWHLHDREIKGRPQDALREEMELFIELMLRGFCARRAEEERARQEFLEGRA